MKRSLLLLLLTAICSTGISQAPDSYPASEILLQMKKLKVLGSVLYIAAHPDDENNALLPYLAKEKLYRTGYLSLTRGDGGQNLIGDEQGIELGLIRTQELIAARKIDGGEQYFTRAYEFGFSKSAEEALRIWDSQRVLSDVVWVIRKFQPDIIIKRFPPDARAGHGHHAASAILADSAFVAAADPNRFPEQFKYGVKPWQARRILWNTFNFGNTNTTAPDQLKIDIGAYNPLIGKSYGEIGGEARTMHKSQGEGRPRRRGQQFEYFLTTNGAPANTDLMEGVNNGWNRLPGGAAIDRQVAALIEAFKPEAPAASVPALVKIYQSIQALPAGAWRDKKLTDTRQLIEACAALVVEATSPQAQTVQGDSLRVNFFLNKRAGTDITLKRIRFENIDSVLNLPLQQNQNVSIPATAFIPGTKAISQPYWLQYPLQGGVFDERDQALIGKAESDPSLLAVLDCTIAGLDIQLTRPVQYKIVDPVKGDVYQPIPVLPPAEISFARDNYVSLNGDPIYNVQLNLRSNTGKAAPYLYQMDAASPWNIVKPIDQYDSWNMPAKTASTSIYYKGTALNETVELTAGIHRENPSGPTTDLYRKTIAYDHIPTQTYFAHAKANLVRLDIKTAGKKIGYIVGAGDRVPQALEALGYSVSFLNEADITIENLKQFDAVITGIRAYNIYEWLSSKNQVLMQYVANGGNMIVQYLKSNQVGNSKVRVGPYPFSVDPGSRVTEEDAAVSFLLPDHPALNFPNKISAADFNGWVQERSTYQAVQLDSSYVTPLSMHDKNEKPSNGSLAIAAYGKGNFVYASLVFFRQLPAGNPGAYRLLANLIALPRHSNP